MDAAALLFDHIPSLPPTPVTLSILAFIVLIYPAPFQYLARNLRSMLASALLYIAGAIEWLALLINPPGFKVRGQPTEAFQGKSMQGLKALYDTREREQREVGERRRERVEAVKTRDRERAEAGRRAMRAMMGGGEEGRAFVRMFGSGKREGDGC